MAERNEMMQQNQKQNIEQKYYYTVMEEQEGMRLDQFLAGELKEHSRSYIQKLIKEGRVTVGDKKEKPGCRLKVEDSVVIKTFGGISLLDSSFFIVFQRDCDGLFDFLCLHFPFCVL